MGIFKKLFALGEEEEPKASKRRASTVELLCPETQPGWDVDAAEYFKKELRLLAGKKIRVSLELSKDLDWDETNVLFEGGKIGQLFYTDHNNMKPILEGLRTNGIKLVVMAQVSGDREAILLLPEPIPLIRWIMASPVISPDMSFRFGEKRSIRIKGQGPVQETLKELMSQAGSNDWTGWVDLTRGLEEKGKYKGQLKILATANGLAIGDIGARYSAELFDLFDELEKKGELRLECRISHSQFDESLYSTLFF